MGGMDNTTLLAMLLEYQLGHCTTIHKTPAGVDYRAERCQQIREAACKPARNVRGRYIVAAVRHALCNAQPGHFPTGQCQVDQFYSPAFGAVAERVSDNCDRPMPFQKRNLPLEQCTIQFLAETNDSPPSIHVLGQAGTNQLRSGQHSQNAYRMPLVLGIPTQRLFSRRHLDRQLSSKSAFDNPLRWHFRVSEARTDVHHGGL